MIPGILEDVGNELTDLAREAIAELHDLFRDLDRRIASFDKKIDRVFRFTPELARMFRAVLAQLMSKLASSDVHYSGVLESFRDVLAADATVVKLHRLLTRRFPGTRTNASPGLTLDLADDVGRDYHRGYCGVAAASSRCVVAPSKGRSGTAP